MLAFRTVFMLMSVRVPMTVIDTQLRLTSGAPNDDSAEDDQSQQGQSTGKDDRHERTRHELQHDRLPAVFREIPHANDGRQQSAEADRAELFEVVIVGIVLMLVIVAHERSPRKFSPRPGTPGRGEQ